MSGTPEKQIKKVIISGGGTGGHLYPALAIGREYSAMGADVFYIGSEMGIEKDIMKNGEFPYELLPVQSIRGRKLWEMPVSAWRLMKACNQAKKVIRDFNPDLIVGTGGYASFPVLKAGESLGIKTLLHEANAEIGKANQKLAEMADCLCVTYEETAAQVKGKARVVHTGMPVRESIKTVSREEGQQYLGIDDDTLVVTITGGSQGAHHINLAMIDYYRQYSPEGKVLFYHIVGKRNQKDKDDMNYPFVRALDYENHMDQVLARTDLCIGRSGASFLAEVTVRGIPCILVPYPYSNGHQEKNAAYYHRCGGAEMILDGEMPEKLPGILDSLIKDSSVRRTMSEKMKAEARPDALQEIIREGIRLCNVE